eukprot:m.28230 g.28230  ORF g.28230 m.28230 type:complete len:114 (-) comp9452_c0_seq2:160-501(-)
MLLCASTRISTVAPSLVPISPVTERKMSMRERSCTRVKKAPSGNPSKRIETEKGRTVAVDAVDACARDGGIKGVAVIVIKVTITDITTNTIAQSKPIPKRQNKVPISESKRLN